MTGLLRPEAVLKLAEPLIHLHQRVHLQAATLPFDPGMSPRTATISPPQASVSFTGWKKLEIHLQEPSGGEAGLNSGRAPKQICTAAKSL